MKRIPPVLLPLLCGTLLTCLFWPQLWQGGGFIGGDTYTYFLPQKAFFADRLQAGEFPLWNSLAGHGYPLIGESQTAPLYPVNPLLYVRLDLNTAYVASHLLHYIAAFVAMWLLAVQLGLSRSGAALAGLVYVYGWFPPRACLEWAIIGGVYLPLVLYFLDRWLADGSTGSAIGLSVALGLDLLAGHFNLAFITVLAAGLYAAGRWWQLRGDSDAPQRAATTRRLVGSLLCVGLGFGLAAPQLVPSWDLKRTSQRNAANPEFDPGYGHLPPWYLCQVATPWIWYARDADPDRALNSVPGGGIAAATNKVEAHLYFGLLPLVLAGWALIRPWWTGEPLDPRLRLLAWIGLFGTVYATGWLLPVLGRLPGFSFFRGPGRYGILASLAVAVLSGSALSSIVAAHRGSLLRTAGVVAVLALTAWDLHWVAGHQWYTYTTTRPIIALRHESIVRRRLLAGTNTGPARMLAPGPNLGSLTGIAVTPPYLGFGPDAYYLDGGRLPDMRLLEYLSGDRTPTGIDLDAQFEWLRQAGVTHILSMRRLPSDWPVELDWSGYDPLLNPAWARGPHEPLYLYAINDARGRVFLEPEGTPGVARILEYDANRVVVTVSAESPATLVLADLPWHEWTVDVNDAAAEEERGDSVDVAQPVQRRVAIPAGVHVVTWRYRPRAFWWGLGIGSGSIALLVAWAWRRRRLPPPPPA